MSTKKQAILDTALQLFVKNGIDATSIRAIAEGADTAEGNIYRHFKNKDDLARTIFLNCAGQFRSSLRESVKQEEDPQSQIQNLVRTLFQFSVNHQLSFSYILIVNHRREIITPDILSKPMPKDVFGQVLHKGMKEGVFRKVEPIIVTGWIVGMVQRSFIFAQREISPLTYEEIIEQTIDAILRMLKA